VKCRQPHSARVAAEQLLHARSHLRCGFVRERDRQNLAGPGLAGENQKGQSVRKHPSLAAAGSGQDQQRSVAMLDSLALWRV
jgi:hypothetical protein